MILDNIELDNENLEFKNAIDLVVANKSLIYLTGKAGTGKTTFLKYLKQVTDKNMAIVAFTGVAAINAGGQTINSFFKIPFGPFIPNDKRLRTSSDTGDIDTSTIYNHFRYNQERLDIINKLELLVIDEVSMVRCDMLDVIDKLLRVFRKSTYLPFGGVQVVLIGDTFQLPPVDIDWHLLQKHYESPFFFSSKVIQNNKPIYIELKKVYRQKELEFITILNRIRINEISENELKFLNSRYNPNFEPKDKENYITLVTHNATADSINLLKLQNLEGEEKLFEAKITGDFPQNSMPCDLSLKLKENAQIIFVKNDRSKGIYNGRIARIKKINNEGIIAEYEVNGEPIEIRIDPQTWNNIIYFWNEDEKKIEEKVVGTFTQFPVKLAWAITVHKSQGLTFDKVIADVGAAFASGQVYVALSRCTTSNGLVLRSRIERQAIKTDKRVIDFAKNETPSTLIFEQISSGKADYYYKKVRESISALNFDEAYDNMIKAFKYRNDFETNIFRKYFLQKASIISSYKTKFHKLKVESAFILSKSEDLKADLINSENTITDLNQQNTTLHNLNIAQIQSIESLSKELSNMKLVAEDLARHKINQNRKIEELKIETNHLLNKKSELQKIKILKNQEIEILKSEIENNKKEIVELNKEIKRIKSISWYQKLIGKK